MLPVTGAHVLILFTPLRRHWAFKSKQAQLLGLSLRHLPLKIHSPEISCFDQNH